MGRCLEGDSQGGTVKNHFIRVMAGAVQPLAVSKEAPAEIQLWNVGDNATDFGNHRWTARSTMEVMTRYEARGNPILVDVEHNGAKMPDGSPAITAGYARLEIRAGAPWLVFDWSDFGREQIKSGARGFLSPEYQVDKRTGEIVKLFAVSLVADPATHFARKLASAKGDCMDPVLIAALMAALENEDPAAAVEAVKSLLAKLQSAGDDAGDTGEPAVPAAAAEPPAPPADEEKKEASAEEDGKMAAAAPKSPTAALSAELLTLFASAKKSGAKADLEAATAKAVETIQASTRDHLVESSGFDPATKRFLKGESLETVQRFLASRPAALKPSARPEVVKGATKPETNREDTEDFKAMARQMGRDVDGESFRASYVNEAGERVFPLNTPTAARARAAALATKGA